MLLRDRIKARYALAEIEEKEADSVRVTPADEAENLEHELPHRVPKLKNTETVRGFTIGYTLNGPLPSDVGDPYIVLADLDQETGISEALGYLRLYKTLPGIYTVSDMFLKEDMRGDGFGRTMYEYAAKTFKKMVSDAQVSENSTNVYKSLARRGFNVYVASNSDPNRHVVMVPEYEKKMVERVQKIIEGFGPIAPTMNRFLDVLKPEVWPFYPDPREEGTEEKYAIGPHSTITYSKEGKKLKVYVKYEPIDGAKVLQSSRSARH